MVTFPNTVLIGSAVAAGVKGHIDIYGSAYPGGLAMNSAATPQPIGGAAISASDATAAGVFVIGVDTGKKYSFVAPDGSNATISTRKFSRPIIIDKVKELSAENYNAPSTEVVTVTTTSSWTPISGEEYVLRLIYKDIVGHPGQFTQSYRYNVTPGDTRNTILAGLAKQINNSKNARVTAAVSSDNLVVTAKEVDNNEGLFSVNEYSYVNFVATFYEADSLGVQPVTGVTIDVTTTPNQGVGYWKTVRDREKWSLGYEGVTNPVDWFGPKADIFTEANKAYDQIVIKHTQPYHSPDNNYDKETDVVTELYVENTSDTLISGFITKLDSIFPAKFLNINASGQYVPQSIANAIAA
jgi:hypothetical protein